MIFLFETADLILQRKGERTLPAQRWRRALKAGQVRLVCAGFMLIRCVRRAEVPWA